MTTETIFIGRRAEMKRLRQDVFFVKPNSYGFCYSLIGLNDIGKTTLIRKLVEEFEANTPKNTFYFPTEITEGISFWLFWTRLVLKLSRSITEDVLLDASLNADCDYTEEITEIYDFFNDNISNTETSEFRSQAIVYLSEIFSYYSEMGIRIIITIDEFDRAQKVFHDGQFFQFLFNLTPKALTRLNLSIITISRRRVSTIAHHMQEGSDFEAAFPPLPLKGFNDAELADYFMTYKDLPCGILPEDAQKQILYLCGRSPGLLMGLRHEFEIMDIMDNPTIDIGWLYAEHGQFIKTAYNRMITLMESTFADREQHKPLLDLFIQQFIGPAYDDNFDTELPLLYDFGFVTKGTVKSNIFSLSGIKSNETNGCPENKLVYEPIAPYFVDYIKQIIIPNDISNLSGLLIKAERLIREVIEKEMKLLFPDTWENVINKYAGQKDYYLETLQMKALQNDFSSKSISKLNVISFKEYYYIINDYWNNFSKYFQAYPNRNALYAAMSLLSESRNDSAHLNLVIYNGENRRKLKDTCSAFIACLENHSNSAGLSGLPSDEQIMKLVDNVTPVTFCCQAIKMPKGNLRGIIKEYGFPAGISHRNLEAFGFQGTPQIGDQFTAIIERWDPNAQMFNLKAPNIR